MQNLHFCLKKCKYLFLLSLMLASCCRSDMDDQKIHKQRSENGISVARQFVNQLLKSPKGLYWEIQHCHKLECSPKNLNAYLHTLILEIQMKQKNEPPLAIRVRDENDWKVDTCLMLMKQFPSLEYESTLLEIMRSSYFDAQTIRYSILALGRLTPEREYMKLLEKSENDVVRAAAIESKAFSMVLQNNIDTLRALYQEFRPINYYRRLSGNENTDSVVDHIWQLLKLHDFLESKKTLKEKIIVLYKRYYEIQTSGSRPIISDNLDKQYAVRQFAELIKSDRRQATEILREIANNERGQDSPSPFASIVYIMEDFGLELNEIEKAELVKEFPSTPNGWDSLFIISDQ